MRVFFALVMLLLLGAKSAEDVQRAVDMTTRFPPTFEDNALAYAFALFSLTVISAMSTAFLSGFLFEKRLKRQLAEKLDNLVLQAAFSARSSLSIYRFQISCLLWMALIGTLPDVLVLLCWGEASNATMWFLFQFDRVMDGFAGIPFALFALSYVLSGGAIKHRLAFDAEDVPLQPRWVQIKDEVKIVGLALIIALGVTLYKAGVA